MYRYHHFMLLIGLIISSSNLNTASLIRQPYGGRFADQLVQYIKCKYLCHTYGLQFLHTPFTYSEALVLDQSETQYNQSIHGPVKGVISTEHMLPRIAQKDCIYKFDYTCDMNKWLLQPKKWHPIVTDHQFMEHIKHMISPIIPIDQLSMPDDCISVAVHIRTGGGTDAPLASQQLYDSKNVFYTDAIQHPIRNTYADRVHPLKFLPLQYYIDQLKCLSELLLNTPLYVYIFTDDQYPERLVELLKTHIHNPCITYNYRKHGNHHNRHVVQDFFTMAYQFDCLIRGGSHYALVADLIGNHKIVIRPLASCWYGNKLVATKVDIAAKDKSFAHIFAIEDKCSDGTMSVIMT